MKLARLCGLLVAMTTLGAIAVAMPAAASSGLSGPPPAPTKIIFSVSPAPVTYPDPQVTISGTLETTGPDPVAVASKNIDLSYMDGYSDVLVQTDDGGHFSWQLTIPAPGGFTATFSGAPGFAPSGATTNAWTGQLFPARVILNPIAPAAYLSTTTVTGTVRMRLPDQSWVPAPLAWVTDSCPVLGNGRADVNGKFSLPIQADPGQQCTITVHGSQIATSEYTSWQNDATSARAIVPLIALPTWFCHGTGPDIDPSPVADIGLSTGACYLDSAGNTHNDAGARVRLYFRPSSASAWQLMATTRTRSDGSAHVSVSGYLPSGGLAAGLWKFVLPAAAGRLGSGQNDPGFGVTITVPTFLRDTTITAPTSQPVLHGRLAYLAHGGPVVAATVVIQRLSSGRWARAGTAQTSASGTFAFRLSKNQAGRYRVRYAGGQLPGAQAPYGSFLAAVSAVVTLS